MLPSIDQGQISGEVAWGCNSRGMLYYEGSPFQPQATSIDTGSGQWRGSTENAKAEMLYYEGSTIAATGHLP